MKVGRKVKEITDFNRKESFSEIEENRKFMISIFYPVENQWQEAKSPAYVDLFSPQVEEAVKNFKNMGMKEYHLRNLKTNCYNDAPMLEDANNYPVIIYSPGIGVDRDMYIFNINKLVLEGYIVITVGPTYDTLFTVFPNKEVVYQSKVVQDTHPTDFSFLKQLIDIRINDISLLLDSLTEWNETDKSFRSKFDLNKIGVIGHSLGGATIYELAKKDERIKAGIILDGSLHLISHEKQITVPFLLVRQQNSTLEQMKQIWSNEVAEAYSEGQKLLYDALTGFKSFIKVKDSDHMTFTDVPVIFNPDESVKNTHDVINDITITFFVEFLGDKNSAFSELVNTNSPGFCVIDREGEPL
jgi:hypothetical protein